MLWGRKFCAVALCFVLSPLVPHCRTTSKCVLSGTLGAPPWVCNVCHWTFLVWREEGNHRQRQRFIYLCTSPRTSPTSRHPLPYPCLPDNPVAFLRLTIMNFPVTFPKIGTVLLSKAQGYFLEYVEGFLSERGPHTDVDGI